MEGGRNAYRRLSVARRYKNERDVGRRDAFDSFPFIGHDLDTRTSDTFASPRAPGKIYVAGKSIAPQIRPAPCSLPTRRRGRCTRRSGQEDRCSSRSSPS